MWKDIADKEVLTDCVALPESQRSTDKRPAEAAGQKWQSANPRNNRRRVELIHNGILRQQELALLFDSDDRQSTIPTASTDVINVYSDVSFDGRALGLALKNGIAINLFDENGTHIGSFCPNVPLKSPKITHAQLLAYYNDKQRLRLAKEFVLSSIHNTNLVIRYYRKQHPAALYDAALQMLESTKKAAKAASDLKELMQLRTYVQQAYHRCYDLFLQSSSFRFSGRTRQPQDEVSALLCFGNAVLSHYIATEIEKTPLDVRIGFLHGATNRLRSLNLDIAEIFRPLIVDRTIFTLINKKEIQPSHFTRSEKGTVCLTSPGKRIVLQALYKKMDTELTDAAGSRSYRQIIADQVRQLVRHFRHGEKYKAFRQVR